MKKLWITLSMAAALAGCKKVVEVNDPAPQEVVYCSVEQGLLGDWTTDSVWVITEVDTLDSLIVNRTPGFFYDMTVECGGTKEFLMTYTGFHNITVVDVRSSNYETVNHTLFTYDPFDDAQDTNNAGFRMRYRFINDTLVNCTTRQELGQGQRSTYYLFFRAR